MNFVVVYEDAATRRWAGKVCNQVKELVGKEALHTTWWKLNDLCQPGVLAGAASKAMRADAILIAVRSTEGFPLPFYVWVNTWLPHRQSNMSALIGLVARPQTVCPQSSRVAEYLRAVAKQGHLQLLLEERSLAEGGTDAFEADAIDKELSSGRRMSTASEPLHRYSVRRWRASK